MAMPKGGTGERVLFSGERTKHGEIERMIMRPEGASIPEMKKVVGNPRGHIETRLKGQPVVLENGRYYYRPVGGSLTQRNDMSFEPAKIAEHENAISIDRKSIEQLFSIGDIVQSGGGRKNFRITEILDDRMRIQPTEASNGTRLLYQKISAVINNIHIIDPNRIEKSVYDLLLKCGLKDTQNESYLYGFANEFLARTQSLQPPTTSSTEVIGSDAVLTHEEINLLRADEAEGSVSQNQVAYNPEDGDLREVVTRQIRARRGQQQFRDALREQYGNRCVVTNCGIVAILEAAHINPYRGDNDNHPTNGLLLRTDIHTLFDLNLLGVEPEQLHVELHPDIIGEYGHLADKPLICPIGVRPSRKALEARYKLFCQRREDAS